MGKKIEKQSNSGITLIALVITIIVLIILAGVGINLVLGQNGILKKAEVAKKDYEEEAEKEEIRGELEERIINLHIEKENQVTMQDIATRFRDEGIVIELEEENRIEGIYKNYEYRVEENQEVILGQKLQGEKAKALIGTAMTSTDGKVKIQLIVEEEVQTIEPSEGANLVTEFSANNKVFEVSEGGTYQFRIVTTTGREKFAKVDINNEVETIEGDSFLDGVSKTEHSGIKKIKIAEKTEEYSVNVIHYTGNLVLDGKTQLIGSSLSGSQYNFGCSNDVGTSSSYAKNTVILKVDGNLTINGGVDLSAFYSTSGYGGPKGLVVYCTGEFDNNGSVSMTSRGAYAPGDDLYLWKNENGSFEKILKQTQNGGSSVHVNAGTGWVFANGNNGTNGTLRSPGRWTVLEGQILK